MKKKALYLALFMGLMICLGLALIGPTPTGAGGSGKVASKPSLSRYNYTDRMIVVYKDATLVRNAAARKAGAAGKMETKIAQLSAAAGMQLRHRRYMSGDGHVLNLPKKMTLAEARRLAGLLMKDPSVKYAEPDARMFRLLEPNDWSYPDQWHYHASTSEPGGVNLPGAWDITTGSSSLVVAVIDTGYLAHEDIDPTRIVQGYDFIDLDEWPDGEYHPYTANDGDGRDPDPSDPGDWITAAEDAGTDVTGGFFEGCGQDISSWHGTHVAGTIGAKTNNANGFHGGVAGVNWNSKILHARVLGKCGGWISDIADAIRWSAGLSVPGVPDNANPAKVLNMSLGGSGACDSIYQSAITDAINAGATIVVAAGNSNTNVSNARPANCNGVISVAALNRAGGRASYSNYGSLIKIAAPGGDGAGDTNLSANMILSTLNNGETGPTTDAYWYYRGTSMAAPHVSGIVSLMLSANPSLTPAQVLARIQASARAFPTGTGRDCTTSTCGAGIINATAALVNPVPSVSSLSPSSKAPGSDAFTLTVNGSNFATDSVVRWSGKDRTTTFVSASRLTASIPAEDVAAEGDFAVSVFSPAPGGGLSGELTFEVKEMPFIGGGGGTGGGGCFIATAAFGAPFEKHVRILRQFRDRCLLTTSPGRAFVKVYYEVSPPIAAKISKNEGLRFLTRCGLMPLVGIAYLTVTCGAWAVFLTALTLLLMAGAAFFMIRRKVWTVKP